MNSLHDFPYVHIHPLELDGKLTNKCCVCESINPSEECYICKFKECYDDKNKKSSFYFCKNCAKHTEKEELLKLHPHELKPKQRFMWSCDLCNSNVYSSGVSMCCENCNFDICVKCFWGLKEKVKIY